MTPTEAVTQYRRLVCSIAHRIKRKAKLMDIEDLIGLGFVGLLEALRRFDESRGLPFEAFAYRRIKGEMCDGVRRQMGIGRRDFRLRDERPLFFVDIDDALDVEDANAVKADEALGECRLHATLHKVVARRAPREREILTSYYFEDLTLSEIGRRVGFSKEWICRLHDREIQKLRREMDHEFREVAA